MSDLLTPEGTLSLAIAVLAIVLGWRFTLPDRGRDVAGFVVFAVAAVLAFVGGRGLVPASPPISSTLFVRLLGGASLLLGLFLAAASSRARLHAGPGRLATAGPYARIRHPLYLGLSLVLVGVVLRAPSALGGAAVTIALAHYGWLGWREEREAGHAFGSAWRTYASRTSAILPLPRRR